MSFASFRKVCVAPKQTEINTCTVFIYSSIYAQELLGFYYYQMQTN